MNKKLSKFFHTTLLLFGVFSVLNVNASNFTNEEVASIREALLSKKITLRSWIASGGTGDVYEAMDENVGKIVAIKISRTDADVRACEDIYVNPMYPYSDSNNVSTNECLSLYCALPKKIDVDLGNSVYICSMPLAECDLRKKRDNNIKYDFIEIAKIIKNIVKGFEELRVRGFYHNDISLGNVLKMSDGASVHGYMLSDFGGRGRTATEEDSHIRMSNSIKHFVEILNNDLSKGNPRNATTSQKDSARSFRRFCKFVKDATTISVLNVLSHEYIRNYGTDNTRNI